MNSLLPLPGAELEAHEMRLCASLSLRLRAGARDGERGERKEENEPCLLLFSLVSAARIAKLKREAREAAAAEAAHGGLRRSC